MNPLSEKLLSQLGRGQTVNETEEEAVKGSVSDLARIYEVARNALEYRADHLMRRAAIERILRRESVFNEDVGKITLVLGQELVWARYVSETGWKQAVKSGLDQIIAKYLSYMQRTSAPRDFVFGVVSSEIEERLNPNSDYLQFTNFAFYALKDRIKIAGNEDEDLLLLAAIETVYSQMDQQGVAYHIFKIIRIQGGIEVEKQADGGLSVAYSYYQRIKNSRILNSVTAAVRKQSGPLFLIRDTYFADPGGFKTTMESREVFENKAKRVLIDQLRSARVRVGRATGRSILYVFLTKVILGVGVEIPLEMIISGRVSSIALLFNLSLPVLIMWLLTTGIKMPDVKAQKKLLDRAWEVVDKMGEKPPEDEVMHIKEEGMKVGYAAFYMLYAFLFILFFAIAYLLLTAIGFSLVSIVVFMFFMSVVTFFAYRIRQAAQVYSFQTRQDQRASAGEMFMLPLVIVGGIVSQGVARLNFLAFVFDFLLEAPFKSILRFFDGWAHFLTLKRDEAMG